MAERLLDEGDAWRKFQAICEAQGGMRTPPTASHRHKVLAPRAGRVARIDNRALARVAKLAGAPDARAAGLTFFAPLGTVLDANDPLFELHTETTGEMTYALEYLDNNPPIVELEDV